MTSRTLALVAVLSTITFALPHVGFVEAQVAKVAFVSPPHTVAPGAISEQITIQTQDASGNEFKVPSTACAALSSGSSGGIFSSNPNNWESVTALTLAKNSANRNFYYKDASEGTHTINVKVVIRPDGESRSCASWPTGEWPSGFEASQTITIGSAGASPPLSGGTSGTDTTSSPSALPASSPSSGGTGTGSAAGTPQLSVNAIVPKQGTAGAPVLFDASAVGLKKEPLQNARYVWSFGDGGTAEGKKLYHTYHYPGRYVVMVTASSGEWSATDRREIAIAAPELLISNVKAGADGFIEIQNSGGNEVDLSFWVLTSAGHAFVIPNGTIIAAKMTVLFPAVITGLLADPMNTALLYPNGAIAIPYTPPRSVAEPPPVKTEAPKAPTPPVEPMQTVTREEKKEPLAPAPVMKIVTETTTETASLEAEAALPSASSTALVGAAGAAGEGGVTPWALGAALLVALSIGGYLLLSHKEANRSDAEKLRREAGEYDIVE